MSSENAARVIVDDGWSRLTPGTLVANRFEVIRLLGEGGMGAVYVAEDRNIGRRVALKLLLIRSPKAAARFQAEARAASRISSRHVAAVHDFGDDPEHGLYMVMELLAGSPLDDVLAKHGELDPLRAAAIGADIAEALAAAHAQGVVHRDLKPANVLMLEEGGLKVLDFGIARISASEGAQQPPGLTAEGMVVGTPTYISPEGAAAAEIGPAADLYSLGVMLFEMVTGRPPFVDDLPSALLTAHVRQRAPRIGELRPDLALPDGMAELVAALLEKDPNKRPRSALEVAETLRTMGGAEGPLRLAGDGLGGGAPTAEALPPVRAAAGPSKGVIAGGVALLLAVIASGLVLALRPGAPPDREVVEAEPPVVEERSREDEVEPDPPVAAETDTPEDTMPTGVEAPPTVQIDVVTHPAHATVTLDGERVEPPLTLPADGAEHALRVEARGHVAEGRSFVADRDLSLEIVLSRRRPRGRDLRTKIRPW